MTLALSHDTPTDHYPSFSRIMPLRHYYQQSELRVRHYLLLTYTSPLLSLPFTIAFSAAPLLSPQSILTGYGLDLNGGQRGTPEEEHWRPDWDRVYDIAGITCTYFEVSRIVGGKANIAAHLRYGDFKGFDSHLPNSSGWTWCDLLFVQFICSTQFSATSFFWNSIWSSKANILVFIVLFEMYMCSFYDVQVQSPLYG